LEVAVGLDDLLCIAFLKLFQLLFLYREVALVLWDQVDLPLCVRDLGVDVDDLRA
jgi:hypothetical protein